MMAENMSPVLNPRLDVNFKAIFTQDTPESRNALKSFLTAAIGRTVTTVTVIKNEEPKEFDTQRGLRYDINCVFDDGTLAQVEMQGTDNEEVFGKRAEYHAARLLSSVLDVGENWDKIPKCYQISVLDCEFDKKHGNFFHHYTMTDSADGATLSDTLNVIFLELPKIPSVSTKSDIENLPSIAKWCKFLKEADNPSQKDVIDTLVASEEGIMNAETTLNNISQDRWRWLIQGKIEADKNLVTASIHYAEKRGREQGTQTAKIESARRFLADGRYSAEEISQLLDIPIDSFANKTEKFSN